MVRCLWQGVGLPGVMRQCSANAMHGAMRRGPGAMGGWVVGASGVQVTGVGARDGVGGNANNNLRAAEVILVV